MSIYGQYEKTLEEILADLYRKIEAIGEAERERTGARPYEHLHKRIKEDESMREKCRRKGLPETEFSALHEVHDAIGIRVVCRFVDDVYLVVEALKALPGIEVFEEKDYIRDVKPNGYRSRRGL